MRKYCQLVIYLTSLVLVLIWGQSFSFTFWQMQYHAEDLLGGKPLPAITSFLVKHHNLPQLLTIMTWVGFAGVPLLTRSASREYWSLDLFFVRFLAFALGQMLLLTIFLIALACPFVTYFAVLESDRHSTPETALALLILGLVGLFVGLAIKRKQQIGREQIDT